MAFWKSLKVFRPTPIAAGGVAAANAVAADASEAKDVAEAADEKNAPTGKNSLTNLRASLAKKQLRSRPKRPLQRHLKSHAKSALNATTSARMTTSSWTLLPTTSAASAMMSRHF